MWSLLDKQFKSRLILGTALYPSPECMAHSIKASGSELITVSLKRQLRGSQDNTFWQGIQALGCSLLPNTAGCRTAKEAVTVAQMAREIFQTNWVKLEVIGDDYTLAPHPYELLNAAEQLLELGFEVFPYCTDDLVVCQSLVNLGCKIVMPLAAPIGSGKGLINPYALRNLRERLPDTVLIVDAGIGCPSDATRVMEMGFDAVLLNSAVAKALDPIKMGTAFAHATTAGRLAYEAGLMPQRDLASPSTPLIDTPFWKQGQVE
jgi:thiazole synthase